MSSILNRFLDDLCDTDAYKQYEYEFNKKRMENEIRMEKKREELETNRMGREDKVTLDMAAAYISQLNMIIKRYHNSKLTKKQKKSKQYSDQYWSKVSYMHPTLSIAENRAIFDYYKKVTRSNDLDNDTIKGRYVGYIHFDRIERGLSTGK